MLRFGKGVRRIVVALTVVSATAMVGAQQMGSSGAQGTFGSPVAIPGATSGEPGVNVAPNGAIYVNIPVGLPTASQVYKSTDGGTIWSLTPSSLRASLPGGGDANVAIDPTNGTLYMIDLWLASATVSKSTDGASSWTAQPLHIPVQDRPWVATAGNGDVYTVTHQIPLGLIVSKSVAPLDGVVYPISTSAATPLDQEGCVCPPGNIIAEPGGLLGDKVGVIYATSTGAVKFAGSTNGGLTFTNTVVSRNASAATNNNFPVVADAGNGKLVAVWMEDFASNDRIQMSTSSNFGANWTTPTTLVDGISGTSVYPWVATNGSKVSVSLYHTSTVTTPDNAPAGTQWFESYTESINGGPFSPLQTLDPTAVKTGIVCTGGTGCSGNRELLDFQTVTLDGAGRANVAYTRVPAPGQAQTMFIRES
jgi:hypothetical protein